MARFRTHIEGTHIDFNPAGWAQIEEQVVNDCCTPMAEDIAESCNESLDGPSPVSGRNQNPPGYFAGTQGDPNKMLEDGTYRATVIAATNEAKADNARNNTLVVKFSEAHL
jgi:hypothetical protein